MTTALTPIGFDVELSAKIGELLGVEVELVNTAGTASFAALDKGEFDLILRLLSALLPTDK
jgi:ABC-type amino acid transport substrate-binding protein